LVLCFIFYIFSLQPCNPQPSKGLNKNNKQKKTKRVAVAALVKIKLRLGLTPLRGYYSCAHGVTLPLVSLRFKTD